MKSLKGPRVAVLLLPAVLATTAAAQYPARPVRILVPFAAAGAKSAGDGYTLVAVDGAYPVLPAMYASLPWDYASDLVPITISAQMPFVVVVSTNAKISSLSELLAQAKASPAKINYGSAGVGGANHVVTELFKRSTGIDLTHVPFRGMGDAMTGLMTGSVDVLITALPTAMSNLKGGRIVPLAVTSRERSKEIGRAH